MVLVMEARSYPPVISDSGDERNMVNYEVSEFGQYSKDLDAKTSAYTIVFEDHRLYSPFNSSSTTNLDA